MSLLITSFQNQRESPNLPPTPNPNMKQWRSEGSTLHLAAVICGCCGRMSAPYEKAGENLSLVCGLGRDELPAVSWVESICDEWAGQRMEASVVGTKGQSRLWRWIILTPDLTETDLRFNFFFFFF